MLGLNDRLRLLEQLSKGVVIQQPVMGRADIIAANKSYRLPKYIYNDGEIYVPPTNSGLIRLFASNLEFPMTSGHQQGVPLRPDANGVIDISYTLPEFSDFSLFWFAGDTAGDYFTWSLNVPYETTTNIRTR